MKMFVPGAHDWNVGLENLSNDDRGTVADATGTTVAATEEPVYCFQDGSRTLGGRSSNQRADLQGGCTILLDFELKKKVSASIAEFCEIVARTVSLFLHACEMPVRD